MKNMNPKISVIMPLYNVEKYLKQSLNSVMNQTFSDIEIICVNDGSTDNTLSILQECSEEDSRIIILNQKNSGCGVARNTGLAKARGEYTIILDGDDFFDFTLLQKLYIKATEDNSDIVVCGYYICDTTNTGRIKEVIHIPKEFLKSSPFTLMENPNALFRIGIPVTWNKLIKKNLYDKYNLKHTTYKCRTDFSCINTLMAIADKISTINESLIYYRAKRKDNLTEQRYNTKNGFLFDYMALNDLKNNLERLHLYDLYKGIFIKKCIELSSNHKSKIEKALAKQVISEDLYKIIYGKHKNE